MSAASSVVIARRLGFVRETEGPNRGFWVEHIQRFGGGSAGESWCCYFVYYVLSIAYRGHPPIPRTGACQVVLDYCRAKKLIVTTPQLDDLYFFVNDDGHAHHIGFYSAATPTSWDGIAGNTSEDGKSDNGDGVYEHALGVRPQHIVFARLPK